MRQSALTVCCMPSRPEFQGGLAAPRAGFPWSLVLGVWSFARSALRQRYQPADQVLLARHPDDLIAELAVLEKEEGRDRADVIFHRKPLVLVDVDFRHFYGARLFLRDLVDQGRDHFARAAPVSPEIDQNRLRALGYL